MSSAGGSNAARRLYVWNGAEDMSDPFNGVSTREHFEEIIARIERSITEQITALRQDIKHLQDNYVTRQEHEASKISLEREVARLERAIERTEAISKDDLEDFKKDQADDRRSMFALVAFVFGAIEFLSRVVIK